MVREAIGYANQDSEFAGKAAKTGYQDSCQRDLPAVLNIQTRLN